MSGAGFNHTPHDDGWLDSIIDGALREGRITFASAPDWRERLAKEPEATERAIFALTEVPSIARSNTDRLVAAERDRQKGGSAG